MRGDRRRRPLLGGLLLGGVCALLLVAWWRATDGYACDSTGVLACAGPALLVTLLGVPAALVAGGTVLRLAGARLGALGVLAVVAVTWLLVLVSELVDPPLATWPVVVGALGTVYVGLEARLADEAG